MLAFTFDKPIVKMMRSRGLDGAVLQGSRLSYELEDAIVSFKPNIDDQVKTKSVPVHRQLTAVERWLDHPFRGNPVLAINSYPTDLRAKVVAANIMEAAMFQTLENKRKTSRRAPREPLWVRIYSDKWGGYIEDIRNKKPGLLIISNLTTEATQTRLEKVRDILTYFDDIPRIVVTGGINPIDFFATSLRFPLNHAVHIGPANKINSPLDI